MGEPLPEADLGMTSDCIGGEAAKATELFPRRALERVRPRVIMPVSPRVRVAQGQMNEDKSLAGHGGRISVRFSAAPAPDTEISIREVSRERLNE